MFEAKYSKFLTVLLIVIIVAVIGLGSILGYNYFKKYSTDSDSEKFVSTFVEDIGETDSDSNSNPNQNSNQIGEKPNEGGSIAENITQADVSSSTGKVKQYKGFNAIGTIEIPKTGVSYPILEDPPTPKKLETAIVALYPQDAVMNSIGNVVLVGHNYRNGQFFSNNKKLVNGDKIYITDLNRNKITYIVYNVYQTSVNDTESYNRDTNGKREITLSTCTDASNDQRIIVLAAEQ